MTNKFNLVLRRLQIKSLGLYSYIYRFNRTSQRRRSSTFSNDSRFAHYIKYMSNWRRAAYISTTLLSLLILATICPISFSSATPAEGIAKDANPATLTFTSTSSTASVNLSVTSTSGNSAASSSNASFTLKTDNATGYTLNLKTSGSDTTLSDGTNTISSITSTSGTTLANLPVNTWGLLPNKYNGADNTTNYYPASSTGFTMDETSAANTTANPYTVGIGIKVNYSTPAGTYTTATSANGNTGATLVAEYVANAVTYSINYYTNTTDTVTNMPTINPQSGTVSQGTTSTSVALASAPTRTGYTFVGWCLGNSAGANNTENTTSVSNITVKTDGNPDVCSTTTYTAGQQFGIDATKSPDTYYLFAMWQRNSYTCTKRYRLQNADGSWGNYTADGTESILYGDTCSYSKTVTNYKNSASGTNNSTASTSGTMGTSGLALSLDFYRNTFTCSKRYRLQNADGTYPDTYTNATGETILYGATCSYSQSYTDYQTQSTSATITSATTLSLDLPRNTYTLTVSAGTNTSSATGGGTYRWGQTVAVGVTKATNVTCTSYATPTWTATAGTAPSAGASSSYTMPKSNATVTATSTASNVSQTITLSRGTGASKITIAGTDYTGTSVSLTCGTYNISGGFSSGYEFNGWSRANGVAVTSTSTLATTMTVTGSGTLTLNAKVSCQSTISGAMQAFNPCSSIADGTSGILTDARDSKTYTVNKINGQWWMTQNLMLGSSSAVTLYKATTNITADTYILPARGTSGTSSSGQYVWGNDTQCTDSTTTACAGYYSYAAATAGTNPSSGAAPSDICPAGWRLPTRAEFNTLKNSYSTASALTGSPFLGVYAGGFYNSLFGDGGSRGYYWSSTARNSSSAYYLYFYSSSTSVTSYSKYYGCPVRCVAKS